MQACPWRLDDVDGSIILPEQADVFIADCGESIVDGDNAQHIYYEYECQLSTTPIVDRGYDETGRHGQHDGQHVVYFLAMDNIIMAYAFERVLAGKKIRTT